MSKYRLRAKSQHCQEQAGQQNQVDGEIMLGLARAAGHRRVDDVGDADVMVVNTCAFIDAAREESVDAILRLARAKGRDAGRRLIVTGCLAERYAEELKREIPEIDALVGVGALERINEAIAGGGRTVFRGAKHYLASAMLEREVDDERGWAYVKVSEGCDHECSFCVIPRIRGRHRSRPIDDVAAEVERLTARGIVEVNLVAQDLSAYGRDLGIADGLAALLYRLGRVRGLERVRCFYLYPSTLTDEALEAMARVETVCKYVDLPLQHADSEVLRRMRRARDADALRRIIERVRRHLGDPVLRTAFITGFPGETDEAFERLLRFVHEVEFDYVAAFRYSPEEGSPAASLDGAVPRHVAEFRRDRLLAEQEDIASRRHERWVGRRVRVLVEGRDGAGTWFGRTEGQAPEIDGVTWLGPASGLSPGRLVEAEITASSGPELFAQVL